MKVKKQLIIPVILVLVLVGLWLWVLGIVPAKKTGRELIEKSITGEMNPEDIRKKAEEIALSLSSWLEKQEKIDKMLIYHQSPRDPFLLSVEKKEEEEKSLPIQPPNLVLKGIAWDEIEPLALINGLVVKEGDTIEGVRIVRIDFERILVRYRSKEFVIKLIEWEGENAK